jgi:hypothetical protein
MKYFPSCFFRRVLTPSCTRSPCGPLSLTQPSSTIPVLWAASLKTITCISSSERVSFFSLPLRYVYRAFFYLYWGSLGVQPCGVALVFWNSRHSVKSAPRSRIWIRSGSAIGSILYDKKVREKISCWKQFLIKKWYLYISSWISVTSSKFYGKPPVSSRTILHFFLFLGLFRPSWIRIQSQIPDQDPLI